MSQYLQTTTIINYDDSKVAEFVRKNAASSSDPREQAISFYLAVRDGIRYDPYTLDLSVEGLSASGVLERGRAWCVPKSVLLAACCRKMGIPARLGFADVRNHLSTKRLREIMKSDVFLWHGYTSIWLDGVWIKVTPAFNRELCERIGIMPLEFDGRRDALFQPFDRNGNKHMEYLRYRGEFPDVPISSIKKTLEREHSDIINLKNISFDNDIDEELRP